MVICNYKIILALTHIICIRVAAAAEEVVYEVVAEPQESKGKPRNRRFVRRRPQAQPTLVASNRLKASPGAHPIIFEIITPIDAFITCD